MTGTSVLGITYKDGVLLASDTLGKCGGGAQPGGSTGVFGGVLLGPPTSGTAPYNSRIRRILCRQHMNATDGPECAHLWDSGVAWLRQSDLALCVTHARISLPFALRCPRQVPTAAQSGTRRLSGCARWAGALAGAACEEGVVPPLPAHQAGVSKQ